VLREDRAKRRAEQVKGRLSKDRNQCSRVLANHVRRASRVEGESLRAVEATVPECIDVARLEGAAPQPPVAAVVAEKAVGDDKRGLLRGCLGAPQEEEARVARVDDRGLDSFVGVGSRGRVVIGSGCAAVLPHRPQSLERLDAGRLRDGSSEAQG